MAYQFKGIVRNDQSGYSVSAAGDVTGDRIDDLIIGAPAADGLAGESYLISGVDLALYDSATTNGGVAGDGIIELANLTGGGITGTNDIAEASLATSFGPALGGDDDGTLVVQAGDTVSAVYADALTSVGSTATSSDSVAIDCFLEGAWIATPGGKVPVEDLRIGDLISTADGADAPVKWLARQTISTRFSRERAEPVRITRGALGDGLPHADLTVTADHGMVIDGLLINAAAVVNGHSIHWVPVSDLPERLTVYHVETAQHDLILANGALSETYLDTPGRAAFDNYHEYLDLYGAEDTIAETPTPRVSSQRLVPQAIKNKLGIEAEGLRVSTST